MMTPWSQLSPREQFRRTARIVAAMGAVFLVAVVAELVIAAIAWFGD